jgi:hypothetical protein
LRSVSSKNAFWGLLVELAKLREQERVPLSFRVHTGGSARPVKRSMVSVVRRLFPSFPSGATLAFRVFRSEQKSDAAPPRIEIVVQTSARARFLLPDAQNERKFNTDGRTMSGNPWRPRSAKGGDYRRWRAERRNRCTAIPGTTSSRSKHS